MRGRATDRSASAYTDQPQPATHSSMAARFSYLERNARTAAGVPIGPPQLVAAGHAHDLGLPSIFELLRLQDKAKESVGMPQPRDRGDGSAGLMVPSCHCATNATCGNNPGVAQAARDLAVVSEDRERSDA